MKFNVSLLGISEEDNREKKVGQKFKEAMVENFLEVRKT